MTFVVTDQCINCRYTDCVEVCPVDCFHEGPNFLVIDPEECIDCALCEPECPVDAIYAEYDLPENKQNFLTINRDLAEKWPIINVSKGPLEEAEKWKDKFDKINYLQTVEDN